MYNKLEEIRSKPEHIRMRYVWLMVTLSMIFVLGIWALSFRSGQEKAPVLDDVSSSEVIDQLKEQKDSLMDVTQGLKGALQQGQQ